MASGNDSRTMLTTCAGKLANARQETGTILSSGCRRSRMGKFSSGLAIAAAAVHLEMCQISGPFRLLHLED